MTYGTHSLDNFVVLRTLNSMEIARLDAADERATSSLPAPEALRAVAERKKLWPVPFHLLHWTMRLPRPSGPLPAVLPGGR